MVPLQVLRPAGSPERTGQTLLECVLSSAVPERPRTAAASPLSCVCIAHEQSEMGRRAWQRTARRPIDQPSQGFGCQRFPDRRSRQGCADGTRRQALSRQSGVVDLGHRCHLGQMKVSNGFGLDPARSPRFRRSERCIAALETLGLSGRLGTAKRGSRSCLLLGILVDGRRLELPTSALRTRRSPS